MKELIRRIQREWRAAKDAAQAQCADSGQQEMAAKLEACDMFKGDETLEELIGLIFSPRGVEFMTAYNFPNIATFRRFKKYHPERYGVYIDSSEISLLEARKVFFDRRYHRRAEIPRNRRKSAIPNVRSESLRRGIGICGRQGRKG